MSAIVGHHIGGGGQIVKLCTDIEGGGAPLWLPCIHTVGIVKQLTKVQQ